MGYFAERLRARLQNMSEQELLSLYEEKKQYFEFGPSVAEYRYAMVYGDIFDEVCCDYYPSEFNSPTKYELAA